MKTNFLINSNNTFSVLSKQKFTKRICLVPLVIVLLFSIHTNAQYIGVGKGKDSEGVKRVVKDEGFTSDFHKKHNKEIVFMKKPTESDVFTEEDIVTTYTYGDDLYFRTFFTRSLINEISRYKKAITLLYNAAYYRMEITLDGKYKSAQTINGSHFEKKGLEKRTTWYGVFLHEAKAGVSYIRAGFDKLIIKHGDKITAGSHKLEFKLFPSYSYGTSWEDGLITEEELNDEKLEPMASGMLTINFNKPLIDPNNADVCMPKALTSDKELEEAMITAFKNRGWEQTPLKARILGDYYVERNKLSGIVERKLIKGAVGYKSDEGWCKYQIYYFAKEHDGSDFNGKIYLYSIGGSSDISCGCLEGED
ncbi:hypothetical protein [Flavivirga jejuensis]|uniref:Uncharacterized protein n=1 Tax=Flavivirga jejuensis TaxID=870487 RepID=A0ABT8WIP8_9FLAO|nr:hypothetical protein [Flavivirga jejuensis]MDO5973034.1 hypothetical protein [Flavivirga jejuensis]